MQLVDAHHHLWCPLSDQYNIGYVWLKKIGAEKPFGVPTAIQRDYLIDEYLTESGSHEMTASIHIQADGAIADPANECYWIDNVSNQHQYPTKQVGFVDLSSSAAQSTLENLTSISNLTGVRHILSRIDDKPNLSFAAHHYLHNARWRDQFELLNEMNLCFDLQCYPQQMLDAAEFFSQFPHVPIVIDHAGSPYDQSKKGLKCWHQGLKALSQLPHCHIKLSGFGMFDRHWGAQSIQPLFDIIVELFSPNRIMFGSNFPVDKLMQTYDFIVNQLLTCARNLGLSNARIDELFSHTAQRFYRIH